MARTRGFSRVRPSNRRQTAWSAGPGGLPSTLLTDNDSQVVGLGAEAQLEGLTLVRIRGSLQAYLVDDFSSTQEGLHCAFGLVVVTAEAFAVGISAIPKPLTDSFFDGWLYHRFFDLHAGKNIVGTEPNINQLNVVQFEVDSKAMRKTPAATVIAAVVESQLTGISSSARVIFDSRALAKLS